eukprot:TCALIF_10200-PA protein Name:"Similar to fdl Probable beta-hexosaminidase fdl (Drosophila melanogaster)" AED:0.06 eAED:0.06 QI:90/0.6/0.33/1/0.4/0.33/6/0/623
MSTNQTPPHIPKPTSTEGTSSPDLNDILVVEPQARPDCPPDPTVLQRECAVLNTTQFQNGLYRPKIDEETNCCAQFCCCCFGGKCQDRSGLSRKRDSDCGVLVIVIGLAIFSLAYYFSRTNVYSIVQRHYPPWTYQCLSPKGVCQRVRVDEHTKDFIGWNQCRMTCGVEERVPFIFWPRPNGPTVLSNTTFNFLPGDVKLIIDAHEPAATKMQDWRSWIKNELYYKHPNYDWTHLSPFVGMKSETAISVQLKVMNTSSEAVDESYEIVLGENHRVRQDNAYYMEIRAQSIYAAKQALETFIQMISFDEITETLQVYTSAKIKDEPKFAWRGLKLDSSTTFFHVQSIENILDGMSTMKMNFLHWKILGSKSFPFRAQEIQELAELGTKNIRNAYSVEQVAHVVQYGLMKGIRVIPELDVLDLQAGFEFQDNCLETCPDSCLSLPCVQLNFTSQKNWDVLKIVVQQFSRAFDISWFHFGKVKPSLNCPISQGILKTYESVASQTQNMMAMVNDDTSSNFLVQISHPNAMGSLMKTYSPQNTVVVVAETSSQVVWRDQFNLEGEARFTDLLNTRDYKSKIVGIEISLDSPAIDEYNIHSRLWLKACVMADYLWSGIIEPEDDLAFR